MKRLLGALFGPMFRLLKIFCDTMAWIFGVTTAILIAISLLMWLGASPRERQRLLGGQQHRHAARKHQPFASPDPNNPGVMNINGVTEADAEDEVMRRVLGH